MNLHVIKVIKGTQNTLRLCVTIIANERRRPEYARIFCLTRHFFVVTLLLLHFCTAWFICVRVYMAKFMKFSFLLVDWQNIAVCLFHADAHRNWTWGPKIYDMTTFLKVYDLRGPSLGLRDKSFVDNSVVYRLGRVESESILDGLHPPDLFGVVTHDSDELCQI